MSCSHQDALRFVPLLTAFDLQAMHVQGMCLALTQGAKHTHSGVRGAEGEP